jgi:plastocyanin
MYTMISRSMRFFAALLVLLSCGIALSESPDVVAHVEINRANKQKASHVQSSGVVVWLNPISSDSETSAKPGRFRLVQKDKSFNPHLLVVPLGSSVDFPNMDPFFHNVFSQFNGKRFDLGLYEQGSDKTVRFDHEGISYIFCNIHPEMSAVVIALATPYVGVANPQGNIELHNVPPDTYEMRVWAEGVDSKQLNALARRVRVGSTQTDLGVIQLTENGAGSTHKNKYGEDYLPDRESTY